jgi:microcystin-dependent protein
MFVEPYLANVTIFAGNFAPRGWMFCQGQLLAIAEYDALYALLGTTYGGDGQTTFGLPDLRSRIAVNPGQGPGLSPIILGQTGGTENVTLTSAQMPQHTHALVSLTGGVPQAATTQNANAPSPTAVPGQTSFSLYGSPDGADMGPFITNTSAPIAGASNPVSIIQPYMAMNYVIAVEGIFPSRN